MTDYITKKSDKKVSKSEGKAYDKAKQKKEDIKFVELMHEKKKLKKHPQSTVTGWHAKNQRKTNKELKEVGHDQGSFNPYNPKSEKNPAGYTGTYPKGSVDKRLKSQHGGRIGGGAAVRGLGRAFLKGGKV